MPKVPQWKPQETGIGAPKTDIYPFADIDLGPHGQTQFGKSIQAVGTLLRDQADKLQERRDLVDAMQLANTFRDTERQMLMGEYQLQGRDARDATKRGTEWYDKNVRESTDKLETDRARFLFQKMVLADRESGLNALAKHESAQQKVYERQVADQSFATHVNNISVYAGDEIGMDKEIAMALADIESSPAYQGQDIAFLKQTAEQKMRTAAIESLIATRPGKALELLNNSKWQSGLGSSYPALLNRAKTAAARSAETMVESDLKTRFGTSNQGYLGMLNWLTKPENYSKIENFDSRSAQWLYNKLDGELTNRRQLENRRKLDSEEATLVDVYNRFEKGDVSGAFESLRANPDVRPDTRWRVENALRTATTKLDPAIYSDILEKIHDGKINRDADIYSQVGPGLPLKDARSLVKYMETYNGQNIKGGPNYITLARQAYKRKWQSVGQYDKGWKMELYEPEFVRELSWYVEKDNLKGHEILKKADEIMGTIEEVSWGRDIIKSPFKERVVERAGKAPWQIEQQVFSQTKDIPDDIRSEIIGRLVRVARQDPNHGYLDLVTADNIKFLYRRDYQSESRYPLLPDVGE